VPVSILLHYELVYLKHHHAHYYKRVNQEVHSNANREK